MNRKSEIENLLLFVQLLLAGLIAGTLDTAAGLGGGLLLLPILVAIAGGKDAVLLAALIPLGWNIPRLWLLRSWVDWRATALFGVGILPGAFLGASFLDSIDPAILRLAIGVMLIVFGGYYILRLYVDLPEPRGLKRWTFPAFGFVSGAVSGVLGAGNGPINALGLSAAGTPVREFVATNGSIGAFTAVARVIGYGINDLFHEDIWLPALIGFVGAWGGGLIGIRLSRRAKDSTLELLIGAVLLLAGIRMVM